MSHQKGQRGKGAEGQRENGIRSDPAFPFTPLPLCPFAPSLLRLTAESSIRSEVIEC